MAKQVNTQILETLFQTTIYWGRVFLIQVKVGSHRVDRGLVRIHDIEHMGKLKDELSEQGFPEAIFRPPGSTYHRVTPVEHPIHPMYTPVRNFGPIPLLKA